MKLDFTKQLIDMLAIGIPAGLFALSFIAILWQSRSLERSFNIRFDARLKHLAH